MPNEYRRLLYGVVPLTLSNEQLEQSEQILISYLRTARDFSLMTDVNSSIEIFKIAKSYVGTSFKDWLIANFNNGVGTRASLVRRIIAWIEGKVSFKAVTSEVRRDLNRIDFLDKDDPQLVTPFIWHNNPNDKSQSNLDFSKVEDKHFFEMLSIMGPELTANFLLSLNGYRFNK